MRHAYVAQIICELSFPPEWNHQGTYLSQQTDGLPICFVVLPVITANLVYAERDRFVYMAWTYPKNVSKKTDFLDISFFPLAESSYEV